MKVGTFNAALEQARADAELSLPEFEATYERLIRRVGREAAQEFQVQTAKAEPVTAAAWQPPPDGNLLKLQALAVVATAALGKLHRRVMRQITGEPAARLGISWTVKHPLTAALLEAAGQRTGVALGEAVQPVLREVIAKAYTDGLSVIDTADLIRESINEAAPFQARMLARTDLNGLSNGGSVAAARLVGVTYKQWLTAEDDRVREEHVEADGQTVPVGQPFQVCGELLDFPGDPAASDACSANCRCTVIYVDDEQASASAQPSGGNMGTIVSQTFVGGAGLVEAVKAAVTITVEDTAAEPADAVTWVSDVAFEGTGTEDGRYILPGALSWRDLPLTLMALTETGPGGHEGAFVAGRMDKFEKDARFDMTGKRLPKGVTALRATGVFDTAGENGSEVARLVEDETVRGVSIDMAIIDWALRDPDTGKILEPDDLSDEDMERAFFGELQFAVREGVIMAATVCPTPAFADARIMVASSGERVLRLWAPLTVVEDALTAGAAGLAPLKPPAEWFQIVEPNGPRPLTVTEHGQVHGHIAVWDSCHTGKPGQCFAPPTSPSGYAYFNLGEVECADGSRVSCGQITLDTFHAPLSVNGRGAQAHYEHTGVCVADVRATDGRFGIWVAGAVRPGVTAEQARALMAAKPSGDWRSMTPGGPLELIGVLAVNVPGFPVPRPEARLVASAEHPAGEAVALVAAGLAVESDAFARSLRVLAARAEGGLDALAELAGV